MSCATVPLEIGVPQQPHHSSPSKRSLMRPKSVARASTPTGFPKASPIVFAYLSSLPDFREDWTWNWCPASSVVPRMIRQEWYPSFWCFGWTRNGQNTPNQGHSKLESIKGHASVNRIKSPSLVETEYVDQTEGMIAQSAIPFSQLVHPDNFSNVIKSTSLISC